LFLPHALHSNPFSPPHRLLISAPIPGAPSGAPHRLPIARAHPRHPRPQPLLCRGASPSPPQSPATWEPEGNPSPRPPRMVLHDSLGGAGFSTVHAGVARPGENKAACRVAHAAGHDTSIAINR
ncbi:Os03g0278566, partial [Oryza sativa Japonica Group]